MKTQRFGIAHSGAGTFDTRYLDNDLRGNAEAGMSGTPATAVVRNNTGWVTENSGQAAIAVSTTSTVVEHGLSVTPSLEAIGVTPLNCYPPTRGQAAIAALSTSTVVTHGLSASPHVGSIGVTPLNYPGVDPGHIWVSDVNATSFTVNCANPPTAQLDFGWRIVEVDPGPIWVSDVNDASFTVNCTNPPDGQELKFGWRVVLSHN